MKPNKTSIAPKSAVKKAVVSPEKKPFPQKYIHWACLIILTFVFFHNYTRTFDEKIDLNGDNIVYYSLGKSLNDGKGFTDAIGFSETPHTHFPPGYPFFIAGLMKLGISSIHAVKVTNGVLLFLSMILLFYLLLITSKNTVVAFTATAFGVLQSSVLRFATIMMSETLFIFFSLIVLLIVLSWKVEQAFGKGWKSWKDILILCLLLGSLSYLYFIRTMGVSLILAVILYYGVLFGKAVLKKGSNRRKYGLLFILVIFALLVPKFAWDIRNHSAGKAQSDYVGDFKKKLNGGVMSTTADWRDRIDSNVKTYTTQWVPSAIFNYEVDVSQEEPTAKDWLKGITIALLLVFGVYRLRKGSLLLFLYIGITMGVLLAFPEQYAGQRYMIPIIPLLIFTFIYGMYAALNLIVSKLMKRKENMLRWSPVAVSWAVCLFFTWMSYPTYAASIKNAEMMAKFKDYTDANSSPAFFEYLQAIRWVKTNVPDTMRVSTRKPEIFYIYSGGRPSSYFPFYATPEEVIDYLEQNNIRYIIIDRWFRHAYTTIIPAVQKYPEKFRVVGQFGETDKKDVNGNPQPVTYVMEFNPQWGYTGEKFNGKPQGQGVLALQDGRTYTGAFADGIIDGYGVLTDSVGNVIAKGIWKGGSLIKPQ